MELTHRNLCIKAAKYLKSKGIVPFSRCQYVVCELERQGESPDAFGFSSATTQLIEVKVSRSDFISDRYKHWRKHPAEGLGSHRCYMCPEGLIRPKDLPDKWGLLWVDESGNITVLVEPERQESNSVEELRLAMSMLRREGIKPQVFSYKNYKTDNDEEV